MNHASLRKIVADVLEIDPELLNSDTNLKTIESFDSTAVLALMLELEGQAGIKLNPQDASKLRYYRDIEQVAEQQGITLVD